MILFAFALFSILSLAIAANHCQPVTWPNIQYSERISVQREDSADYPGSNATVEYHSIISTGNVTVGEINCRYSALTGNDVNYYTCTQLADKYDISNEAFFKINPKLLPDCSNIQPDTLYCVRGCKFGLTRQLHQTLVSLLMSCFATVVEPLRSKDGFCGPHHDNATCLGTAKQCCNAETWTCGDLEYEAFQNMHS